MTITGVVKLLETTKPTAAKAIALKDLSLAFRILSEFELKGDGGDHLLHFSATLRACLHWGVCELSLQFKLVAAGITLILIYWHWLSILLRIDHAP